MPLVQQGSTLNTATGDTANQTWNHYNAELANGDLALYIANGSGVASLRITNAAGELIRELNTPGFNTIREMVALPDGGLLLLGFQTAPVAGLAAQVLNADGTFRTAAPVLITSNLTLLNGGSKQRRRGVAAERRGLRRLDVQQGRISDRQPADHDQ